MVRDRIPVRTRFSARPDPPLGLHSLLYNGYRVFPGGKVRTMSAVDHSPPSSVAVTEEYSCTSTHPLGHTGPVTACTFTFHTSIQEAKFKDVNPFYRIAYLEKIICKTQNIITILKSLF